MQLTPVVAPQPAGVVLKPPKPIATKCKVRNAAGSYGYGLLRRTNHPPPPPLPAHSNVRMTVPHRSCPAARAKAHDDEAAAEPDDEPQAAPAKEGEEEAAAAGRKRNQGAAAQRSMAYQIFEAVYLCAYILSWRIGEAVVANAEDALKRLRGYVLDKFNQKR